MMTRILDGLRVFFETWRFPTFMLSMLLFFNLILVAIIVLPPSANDPLSKFAADFKRWCFDYNAETGEINMHYVLTFFIGPAVLAGIVALIWGKSVIAAIREHPLRMLPYCLTALAIALGLSMFLPAVGFAGDPDALPAAELRTHADAPAIELTNHEGDTVRLDDFTGRVVIITGVYSCCVHTCPLIMDQVLRVTGALDEVARRDVTVLAVTLDPARDTPEKLHTMADNYDVAAPAFNLLTGTAEEVNAVLDAYRIERWTDPETGIISHANLFFLIDRAGDIAYRFSLSDRQEKWMLEALRLLVAEDAPPR